MSNFLDSEAIGLGQNSTDPVMAAINGVELVQGLRSANNIEFSAESADLEKMMPTVEDDPGVYSPTTTGEIDILTGGSNDNSVARGASATNPNAEDVHRFWDEQTQVHLFTADEEEFDQLRDNSRRYRYEGVEFEAPLASVGGALPVYRFENETTGTFFYTLQSPDAVTGDFPVLESDGIAFYAFSPNAVPPSGAVPIYRFFNGDASSQTGTPVHFYTGTDENRDNVRNNFPSFTYEGPGWYAYPRQGSSTSTSEESNTSTPVADPLPPTGSTLSAFEELGFLRGEFETEGFVGSSDRSDYYRFTLPDNGEIDITLGGVTENASFQLIKDFRGDGAVNDDDVLSVRSVDADSSIRDSDVISRAIEAGTYFLRVYPNNRNNSTNYNLRFNFTPQPSNTIDNPEDTVLEFTGELGTEPQLFSDYVGVTDRNDYYSFTLPDNGELVVGLDSGIEDATFQLIADNDDVILQKSFSEGSNDPIQSAIEAGTYSVRIYPTNSRNSTNYTLGLGFVSVPSTTTTDPGNELGAALDIGELQTTPQLFTDYVGVTDRNDYYSFTVGTTSEVSIALRNVTKRASFQLINDIEDDGTRNTVDIITGTSAEFESNGSIAKTLEAGTYFVWVSSSSSNNTNYDLRIAIV